MGNVSEESAGGSVLRRPDNTRHHLPDEEGTNHNSFAVASGVNVRQTSVHSRRPVIESSSKPESVFESSPTDGELLATSQEREQTLRHFPSLTNHAFGTAKLHSDQHVDALEAANLRASWPTEFPNGLEGDNSGESAGRRRSPEDSGRHGQGQEGGTVRAAGQFKDRRRQLWESGTAAAPEPLAPEPQSPKCRLHRAQPRLDSRDVPDLENSIRSHRARSSFGDPSQYRVSGRVALDEPTPDPYQPPLSHSHPSYPSLPSCTCPSTSDSKMADGRPRSSSPERVSHVAVDREFFVSTPSAYTLLPTQPSRSSNRDHTEFSFFDAKGTLTDPTNAPLPSKASDISDTENGLYRTLSKHDWVESEECHAEPTDRHNVRSAVQKHVFDPILTFISPKFQDEDIEAKFRREKWFLTKRTALLCSLFITVQWVLSCALMTYRASWMYGAYVGICGFFAVTLPFLVMFDEPLRANVLYQTALACTVWSWGLIITVEMDLCGESGAHYGITEESTRAICGDQPSTVAFMQFGVIFGLPTLAVIGLHQNRLLHVSCATIWMVISAVLLLRNPKTPPMFIRNIVIMEIYHILLAMIDHLRERTDRQLFKSQNQIRMQNIAMKEAQAMEQKAQATKKSFVSYIFHEVRVPLNTALLVLQNLDGEGMFKDIDDDQAIMVNGLMGSLTMMEKVLNDVLSHSRMEHGTLVQVQEPFDFHKSMHLVGLSYRSQAELSGVKLQLELDPAINRIAPVFVGDEMRLRQITCNLVSNALKFTRTGGTVRLVTKLIYPPVIRRAEEKDAANGELRDRGRPSRVRRLRHSLDLGKGVGGSQMSRSTSMPSSLSSREDTVVVRVEVHDTGVGIKEADLVDNNLFSPYVQTEIGRRQGGKGSGLGLALVMQIVKLSHGRLGVDSEIGKGSCFWFEMPYGLPSDHDQLPLELRRMLLTKPSFAHVMGSPEAAMSGLPDHRGSDASATSAEEVIVLNGAVEGRRSSSESRLTRRDASLNIPRISPPWDMTPTCSVLTSESRRPSDAWSSQMSSLGTESPRPQLSPPMLSPTSSRPFFERAFTNETEEVLTPPDLSPATPGEYQSMMVPLSSMSEPVRPPVDPSTEDAELPEQPRRKSSGRSLSALIVDDDSLTRRLMSRMLSRLGHNVTALDNGKKALDLIRAQPEEFEIVFLDNQMPIMNGVEVVSALRADGNDIFVVGCTGNALKEDQDEYLSAGANAIIAKPVHQASILEQLSEAKRRIDAKFRAQEDAS